MFKPENYLNYELRIQALRDYREIVYGQVPKTVNQNETASTPAPPSIDESPKTHQIETATQWFYWLLGEICEYAHLTVSKVKLSFIEPEQQAEFSFVNARFKWGHFQPEGTLKDGYLRAITSCLSLAHELFTQFQDGQSNTVASLQPRVKGEMVTKRQVVEFFQEEVQEKIIGSGIRSQDKDIEIKLGKLAKKKIAPEWRREIDQKPLLLPWFVGPLVDEDAAKEVQERRLSILRVLGTAFQAPISTFEHQNQSSPIGLPSISTERIFEYIYNQDYSSLGTSMDKLAPRPADLMTVMSQVYRVMECEDKRQFLTRFNEEYSRIISDGNSKKQDLELEKLLILPK